jgi:flagellar biosynthesis/type III secretory pathway protein FliH
MNTKNWKQRFIDEFGIHFSTSELQFALAFIEEEIREEAYNRGAKEERPKAYAQGYEDGYKRGQLAEIEANATADITIAMDKVEQIREEAYDRGAMEATTVANDVIQKAREEAKREALGAVRDLVKKQEPMSLADSYSESDDCIDREVLLTSIDSLTNNK